MIPDKIFINPIPKPSDGYVGIAWTEAHGDEYKVYIRKDAVLEWAKEQMTHYPHAHEGIGWGQWDTFWKVIKKIESL